MHIANAAVHETLLDKTAQRMTFNVIELLYGY
jgi:hypothetical protein